MPVKGSTEKYQPWSTRLGCQAAPAGSRESKAGELWGCMGAAGLVARVMRCGTGWAAACPTHPPLAAVRRARSTQHEQPQITGMPAGAAADHRHASRSCRTRGVDHLRSALVEAGQGVERGAGPRLCGNGKGRHDGQALSGTCTVGRQSNWPATSATWAGMARAQHLHLLSGCFNHSQDAHSPEKSQAYGRVSGVAQRRTAGSVPARK